MGSILSAPEAGRRYDARNRTGEVNGMTALERNAAAMALERKKQVQYH